MNRVSSPKASQALQGLLAGTPFELLTPVVCRWLNEQLARLPPAEDGAACFSQILERLNIGWRCGPDDLERIPKTGGLMVAANHPFGGVEGIVLGAVISKVRPDIRLVANSLLASIPGLRNWMIPVNPFGGARAVLENRTPVRKCVQWLKAGGVLAVFPAGEVATIQFPGGAVTDREWNGNVARLSRLTGASVLPVFFHGSNGPAFHAAGLVHPRLRTVLLPREFFNKAGKRIRLSIGTAIAAERLAAASNPTAYVRGRTLLLEARAIKPARPFRIGVAQRIGPPQDASAIAGEIEGLPRDRTLARHGEYLVCVAAAGQIPRALKEIGRLREIAFRQAGEGTGRAADLDAFDAYYQHLFVWNEQAREIVGAYRFAGTGEVIASMGVRGLYTNTLFRLTPSFYRGIQPALELGRSFVRPEYQKSFLPLLLLWKGIGHYVARTRRYRFLFGPVSISAEYSPPSRALMVSYLKSLRGAEALAECVKPRKPFRAPRLAHCDPGDFSLLLSNLDELSEIIADIEPDHKKLPVLLRHYLNLGGRVVEFNLDRRFSNALDGLLVLDLAKVGRKQLDRFMGPDNAGSYLRELHSRMAEEPGAAASA
ncbi:MAG TPA: GNAT family N-acyltransferase [Bryobacteraceae bacterium]|nr:GNAT family N-acyltransferase [Bryobacteraceae bacterium]